MNHVKPDAFIAICPSRVILARLGEKWSMLILVALMNQTLRFGALKKQLDGVSQKMLTQTLRHLERDGMVERTFYNEMPLRVEYSLTPMGKELAEHVKTLKQWAEKYVFEIEARQKEYDAK
ncbi:MAG: helix-turn-helix domain-containing protein [Pseudomonadota bacterium]